MATNLEAALSWTTTSDGGPNDVVGPFLAVNTILDERFELTQRRWSNRRAGSVPFPTVTSWPSAWPSPLSAR